MTVSIAVVLIQSRLDYANSVCYGISTHDVLHRCSASAGLVCVSSVAAERLTDGTDLVLAPGYQACNSDPARTRLRSASSSDYTVSRTRTGLGDRPFSVAGPVVWNSLPTAVREADSLHSFRRKLKTHLFTLCFND